MTARKKGEGSKLNRAGLGLLVALVCGGLVYTTHALESQTHLDFLSVVESKLVDLRFRLRGERVPAGDVVVVAIDSKSIEKLGRWPWSRTSHAQLIDRLREFGASAVAFDVLFTEPEGIREAERMRATAATFREADPKTADAIDGAAEQMLVDRVFAEALQKTFDADKALTVLAFDFVFPEDLSHVGQLGKTLSGDEERLVLDIASYPSRDANVPFLYARPPKLALGLRPVIGSLAEQTAALGFANPVFDGDGMMRRDQVLVTYTPAIKAAYEAGTPVQDVLGNPESGLETYMSLAVAGVTTHLRLAVDQLQLDLEHGQLRFPLDKSKEATGDNLRALHFDIFDGSTLVNYYGPSGTIPTYSFSDVLVDDLHAPGDRTRKVAGPELLAGKLVFVGMTDPGLGDYFPTAFTARLPGVEKHATVAQNMLSGNELRQHNDPEFAIILSVLAAALLVGLTVANLPPVLGTGLLVAATTGFVAYTQRAFNHHGLLWNWAVPGAAILLSYAGVMILVQLLERGAKQAMAERSKFIQNTFGRYLSQDVVKMLVDSEAGLELGGQRKRITILMSDLRGFTALCERSTPEVVIGMLNLYLGKMADTVIKHGGTVDEFIGDAVLALFGVPVSHGNDAQRAIACAIEMQQALPEVNRHLREQGLPEVEMGVALNTGEVIVGNIGSETRAKYGVVGSNVNLTSRIESYTVGGQVLISGATLHEAGDIVMVGEEISVKAKGLKDPVPAYDLLGIGGEFNLRMPEIVEHLFDLPAPIRVDVVVLEGKHLSDAFEPTELVRLSKLGADMKFNTALEARTNLKLTVRDGAGKPIDGDLYAKVIDRPAAAGSVAIRFTGQPPEIKKYLKEFLKE